MTSFNPNIPSLSVEYISTTQLVPYVGNARTHSPKQIEQIKQSIERFGFTNPILIDGQKGIIAGHGRIKAAQALGMATVPCIELGHLTEAEKRAYIIADNKIAENAGWDKELLKIEFSYLADLNFDLPVLGFEMGEIDAILNLDQTASEDPMVELPKTTVTQLGDVWQLGRHKIICGSALEPTAYQNLLGHEKAAMVFVDPPYNVPVAGHICTTQHKEFVMASGEMSSAQFTQFLSTSFSNLQEASQDGAIHYVCMDWRHMTEILAAGQSYTELKNICVWNKTNGGMGSLYRSKHELVFVFKHGKAPHINNIELGKHGRYRTNVWDYAGVNTFTQTRDEELAAHPTVKPIKMVEDAILDCSNRQHIILDAFGGSGTTLLAAENTGRTARLIELDPLYVDVTIQRFEKMTRQKALHAETGLTYQMLREQAKASTDD